MWQGILIAALLMLSPSTVLAQADSQQQAEEEERKKIYLFQWVDDKGGVHITDGLGKVPEKYRSRATKMEQPKDDPAGQGRPAVRHSPYGGYSDQDAIDEDRKSEWQLRMRNARQQLAEAEQRYRALEQQRQDAMSRYGGPALGRKDALLEAERIEQEMKKAKQDVDALRDVVENTLPEEARRAGVPPGWLRE